MEITNIMQDLPAVELNRYFMDKIRYSFSSSIPRHLLLNGRVEQEIDRFADAVVYNFTTYLSGREYKNERVAEKIQVPITWWEHFRERFAPPWALKRWPIQYKIIETKIESTVTMICPHIEVPPGDEKHFEWVALKCL